MLKYYIQLIPNNIYKYVFSHYVNHLYPLYKIAEFLSSSSSIVYPKKPNILRNIDNFFGFTSLYLHITLTLLLLTLKCYTRPDLYRSWQQPRDSFLYGSIEVNMRPTKEIVIVKSCFLETKYFFSSSFGTSGYFSVCFWQVCLKNKSAFNHLLPFKFSWYSHKEVHYWVKKLCKKLWQKYYLCHFQVYLFQLIKTTVD